MNQSRRPPLPERATTGLRLTSAPTSASIFKGIFSTGRRGHWKSRAVLRLRSSASGEASYDFCAETRCFNAVLMGLKSSDDVVVGTNGIIDYNSIHYGRLPSYFTWIGIEVRPLQLREAWRL